MADKNIKLVLVTVPDEEAALKIAQGVVGKRLAACVNILPGVRSIYRWEGKIEDSSELLLLIKTGQERYSELEMEIAALHPYTTPEIIAVDIAAGAQKYCSWVLSETER